jgi:hypothetical protein
MKPEIMGDMHLGKETKGDANSQTVLALEALRLIIPSLKGLEKEQIPKEKPFFFTVSLAGIAEAYTFLREKTGKGKEIDPFVITDGTAWINLSASLARLGLKTQAYGFMVNYLALCLDLQIEQGDRMHKGATYFWLSQRSAELDYDDLSLAYMMLALIEDVKYYGDKASTTPAYYHLVNVFNASQVEIESLIEFCKTFIDSYPFLPDTLLLEYFAQVRTKESEITIPFGKHFLRSLCKELEDDNKSRDGRLLEKMMLYLFLTSKDFEPGWRKRGDKGEFDLLVRYVPEKKNRLAWIGDYLLVECKDKEDTVSVSEIGFFLTKLITTRVKAGIMVSRKGLSGEDSNKYSKGLQITGYSQFEVAVLEVRMNDICGIGSPEDFVRMLQQKYEDARFGTHLE